MMKTLPFLVLLAACASAPPKPTPEPTTTTTASAEPVKAPVDPVPVATTPTVAPVASVAPVADDKKLPAGCKEAITTLDDGDKDENAVTVQTPDSDHVVAKLQKRTGDKLAALKPGDAKVAAAVKELATKLRASSDAVNAFADASRGGKTPSAAVQTKVQTTAADRGASERSLRATCK